MNIAKSLFITLGLAAHLAAVPYSFEAVNLSADLPSGVDSTVILKAKVRSLSDENIDLKASRTVISSPRSWEASLCFGLCYPADAGETDMITFYPDMEMDFELDVKVKAAESGSALYRIYIESGAGDTLFLDFSVSTEGTSSLRVSTPDAIELRPATPNPFNPATQISFSLSTPMDIQITVSDLLGRQVIELAQGHFNTGMHQLRWDGRSSSGLIQASGTYIINLRPLSPAALPSRELQQRITLIK